MQSVKDTKFESNSQRASPGSMSSTGCLQSVKDTKFESNSQHVFVKMEINLYFCNHKSLDADRLIKLSDRDVSAWIKCAVVPPLHPGICWGVVLHRLIGEAYYFLLIQVITLFLWCGGVRPQGWRLPLPCHRTFICPVADVLYGLVDKLDDYPQNTPRTV